MTDELTRSLRELGDHAYQDLTPTPGLAASVLTRWRRRRQLRAAGGAVTVACTAGVVAAVVILAGGSGSTSTVTNHGPGRVPCANPPRSMTNALRWPCPAGTVTTYYQQQFDHPQTLGLVTDTKGDWKLRILAFGALPHSRAGSTIVVGEAWKPGTTQPVLIVGYATPAKYLRYLGVTGPANTAKVEVNGAGNLPSDQSALVLLNPPRLGFPIPADACARLADTPPRPGHGYLAACADVVATRSDVTAIRLVHRGNKVGSPIPVHDGLVGLNNPRATRKGWTIQGLDAEGNVLSSIAWTPTM